MRVATALFKSYEDAGFVMIRWKRHPIWRCPCGHTTLRSPGTPGKGHSIENCMGDIARTIKTCNANMNERKTT